MSDGSALYLTGRTRKYPGETFSWGPGIHRDFVLHYILKGRGFFETDGKKYSVGTNESFIIFPGKTVYYHPDPKAPWEYTWVNFNGSEVKHLLSMTDFYKKPVAPAAPELESLYNAFSNEIQLKHVRLKNTGLLQVLLAHYIKLHSSVQTNDTPDYLYHAKQYISANSYRSDFSVNELSAAIGIERSYLYRLFMESEGISPVKYIINTRMESAAQMLREGTQQIKLVSYSVGYDNPLYFSSSFKKKFGISPKDYVKKHTLQKASGQSGAE